MKKVSLNARAGKKCTTIAEYISTKIEERGKTINNKNFSLLLPTDYISN